MRDRDDLDRMIDAALASYGDVADCASSDPLENRVLRGVVRRVDGEHRRRRVAQWLTWTASLATAACCAALLALHPWLAPNPVPNAGRTQTSETHSHEQFPAVASARTPQPSQSAPHPTQPGVDHPLKRGAQLRPLRKPEQPEPLPKLGVFPAPYSPTEEEAALSFFIQRASASELQDLLTTRAHLDAPVTINQLEIPPIASLNSGGK